MAASPHRRPRGTAKNAVPLYAFIAPEAKTVLDTAATALNVPQWVILEALLRRTELDEHGRPTWWSDETAEQEELPLARPA